MVGLVKNPNGLRSLIKGSLQKSITIPRISIGIENTVRPLRSIQYAKLKNISTPEIEASKSSMSFFLSITNNQPPHTCSSDCSWIMLCSNTSGTKSLRKKSITTAISTTTMTAKMSCFITGWLYHIFLNNAKLIIDAMLTLIKIKTGPNFTLIPKGSPMIKPKA